MRKRTTAGIVYEDVGEGLPLVAFHGATLDRRMSLGAFEPLFDREGRTSIPASAATGRPDGGQSSIRYRRIYPDLPFMGESLDLPEPTSSDAILEALSAFIREVLPTGSFLLAGESYGGYMARGLLRDFGDRVAGLFLLCPSIVSRKPERDIEAPVVLRDEEGWRDGADPRDMVEFEECSVSRTAYTFERTKREILPGIALSRSRVFDQMIAADSQCFTFDNLGPAGRGSDGGGEAFDPRFERPACFVLGRQDASVGWRDALRLAGCYPRASFHVIDAAGHNLQVEQAGLFGAAFGGWLGEVEAGFVAAGAKT
jgi:pimeloyl-ACP methyl ester carboxylesterase